MNILLVIGSLKGGGAERVISEMANYWSIKNWNVTVFLPTNDAPFYTLHKNVRLEQFDLTPKKKGLFKSLYYSYQRVKKTIQIIKWNKIDVVISFMTIANVESAIASKIATKPIIISDRNNPIEDPIPKLWKIFKYFFYNLAPVLVIQTRSVKEFYKWYKRKIVVIKNPIRKLNMISSQKENLVLAVGRLEEQKGFDFLIKSFSNVNNDYKLCILGEGKERRKLENLIIEENLTKRIILPGAVKNIDNYLSKAKIFVLSSRFEGYPNALCEAMAAGLACISFDCPFGPSEIITDSQNGILVETGNIYSLSEQINRLTMNNNLSEKLARNAKEIAEDHSLVSIMVQWENLIISLTKRVN